MAQMKHSPTPWRHYAHCMIEDANGRGVVYVDTRPDTDETEDRDAPNAERMVACVNACEELPDPAKLASLIEWLRTKLADGEQSIDCISVLQELGIPVELGMAGEVIS